MNSITMNNNNTSTVSKRRIRSSVKRVTVALAVALLGASMPTAHAAEGALRAEDFVQENAALESLEQQEQPMSDPIDLESFEPVDLTDFLSEEQLEDQSQRHLSEFCNVCGTSPNGFRGLTNHGKQFWNNGKKWTCGQVQASMRDVRVSGQFATQQDRNWCATVQQIVIQNCDCYGAALVDEYKDPNKGCVLCPGQGNSVPSWKAGQLTQTGVIGSMNCGGLELAMKEGVLAANMCAKVRQNSRKQCCSW